MLNFTQFLRKKWQEYSSSSGQKGTVVDEIAVKPAGLVLGDFYNALVEQRRVNDISNWQTMTDEELDFFGNKYFLPRIQGSISYGYVRIFFDEKKDIDITIDLRAKSDTGLLYQPVISSIISRNSFMISNESSAKYYIDVQIKAITGGSTYNIDVNMITSLTNTSFTYKKVTNPEKISGGSQRETNQEYYTRLIYSINDRSMMNKRSTFAKLKEFFPYISSMYIAAPGDKYMKRDLVQALDISLPMKKAEYLGKISGDNTINNSAYWGIFPPEAGTRPAGFRGPFSIYSEYKYPLTIEAVNLLSEEVGLHGYPLDQEATTSMYQGLYFNDFKNFMRVSTSDLFNILNEGLTLTPVTVPNADWITGANGRPNGDYGTLNTGLGKIDVISFKNNEIMMGAGSSNVISISKDINKRTGLKITGTFKTPGAADNNATSLHSGLQFMIAGVNEVVVDAFTGIGFGFRLNTVPTRNPNTHNAIVYFAHSEKYGSGQVFAATDDFIPGGGHISISNINALAEKSTRLTPNSEYEFEFIINDNLSLSLYIKKVVPIVDDPDDIFGTWTLPETILNIFEQEINKIDTTHYGTMMKVTLDTKSTVNTDKWYVYNLKAFDIAQHRSNSLFIFDVQELETPLSIVFRGSGTSSINGTQGSGYSVYIWDTEQEAPAGGTSALSLGGWTELEGISNPTGLKDSVSTNLVHDLSNIDQYKVTSRYGESIILLAITTGTSQAKIRANGELIQDIASELQIDYIKIESQLLDTYHANNKADIYVSTIKNVETPEIVTTTVDKGSGESYFLLNKENGFKMPIADIKTVSINITGELEELAVGTYKIIRSDINHLNSDKETIYLSVDNNAINSVTVEYTSYQDVSRIQDFYDSSEYSKLFGNVIIKHKFPCYLDISLFYSGTAPKTTIIDSIKTYIDANIDGILSVKDLISYLYNQELVNNIKEPLEISYSKYDDDLNIITGTFTDTIKIRHIDFFRIRNISADKL